MTLLQILILGVVQGITEFLPVSSSGHLVVAQTLFRQLDGQAWPDVTLVNVLLHAGTLLAIIVFYWQRIVRLLTEDRHVLGLLAVGTIPAVTIGLSLKQFTPQILENPLLTGFMFLLTGALLIWGGRREGKWDYKKLTYAQAFGIGLFQAAGILPGISRSGWTIAGAMLLGARRESATTFSFLLAIPAIGGATLLEILSLPGRSSELPISLLSVGTLVAFGVGLASLWLLVRIVERGRLAWFAAWLFPLGIVVIIWQLAT